MKSGSIKIWHVAIGLLIGLISLLFGFWVSAEEITHFQVNIKIDADATITIQETIFYDFGNLQKHGIYRNIPISYQGKFGERKIDISVSDVMRNEQPEMYEVSNKGKNKEIKIGQAEVFVDGLNKYEIIYKVTGAINYFDEFDEFYWNLTGNQWPVPIKNVRAEIFYSGSKENIQVSCYQGEYGSDEECLIENGFTTIFQNKSELYPKEGMTIAFGMPKGYLDQPGEFSFFMRWLKNNFIIALPVLVFVFMFLLWFYKGRDPKGKGTIIPEYHPPQDLKPTLLGSLIDEKVDNRDITAGIIYLAQQGFLKIKKIEKQSVFSGKDYELILLKDIGEINSKIEKDIGEIIFGNNAISGSKKKMSKIKKDVSMSKKIKLFKRDINEEMVLKGYYKKNPEKVRGLYMGLGIGIIFLAIYLGDWFGAGIVALIVSGVIIMGFGWIMSKKTKHGAETKESILGFKEFLAVTDKDRLEFHNAPEKDPKQFMKFLPFAIAMGVEKKWAKQFADMYIEPPTWYEGGMTGNLIALSLIDDLSGFTTNVNSGFSAAARGGTGSGGSGFSGGGFGGGGGGSW